MNVETTAAQALHGARLTLAETIRCRDCETTLGAGDQIIVRAEKRDLEWIPTRVFCPECQPQPGEYYELTLAGRLTTTSDPSTQKHALTVAADDFTEPNAPVGERMDTESESTHTTDAESNRALVSQSSVRNVQVYHLDDGTGNPLCRSTGTYDSLSIEEAKERTSRLCRSCECQHHGEHDTRPCPHCGESVALTWWPMHVRDCSETDEQSSSRSRITAEEVSESPPEQEPESGSEPESESDPTPESDPKPKSKTDPSAGSSPLSDSNSRTNADSDPETGTDADSDSDPDSAERDEPTPSDRGQDHHRERDRTRESSPIRSEDPSREYSS